MRVLAALLLLGVGAFAQSPPQVVRTRDELVVAVAAAKPGDRIEIASGEYAGGLTFERLHGAPARPIVIAGSDPARPPRFVGGGCGMHLVDPRHVELRDLRFEKATGNGVNVDDGGVHDPAPRGLALHRLQVADVGPRGNCDGIKLSGLTGFLVADCAIERWGIGGGSGIDMVGATMV
ncbi:MAG: hypothetical protein IPK26_06665 [Planctomycetes bacterium]|nr:hypothetical protein [Planctomycetota bacterium]